MGLRHSKGSRGREPEQQHGAFPYRHVVVTGASSGIGAAVAVRLSSIPGMTLTLIARHVARLTSVKAACEANGARVQALTVDVTDREAMTRALDQANDLGSIDLVIANAGMVGAQSGGDAGPSGCLASKVADALYMAATTNILGTLNTIGPALRHLRASAASGRPAAVAVVSSVSALPANSVPFSGKLQMGLLPYAWTKQALLMLGKGLQGELADSGVAVFTICPGVVLTDLATDLANSFMGTTPSLSFGRHVITDDARGQLQSSKVQPGETLTRVDDVSTTATGMVAKMHVVHEGSSGLHPNVLLTTDKQAAAVDMPIAQDTQVTTSVARQTLSGWAGRSGIPSTCRDVTVVIPGVTAEGELMRHLNAMTPEEAAAYICGGLATAKGGLIAFPPAAVTTMKIMAMLPEELLLSSIRKGMAKYNKQQSVA